MYKVCEERVQKGIRLMGQTEMKEYYTEEMAFA